LAWPLVYRSVLLCEPKKLECFAHLNSRPEKAHPEPAGHFRLSPLVYTFGGVFAKKFASVSVA